MAAQTGSASVGGAQRPARAHASERQTLYVEDPKKSLPRSLVPSDELSGDAFADSLVASGEIRANEPILTPEQRVQRCLGDTGSLDDAVDADGMDPFLIEELIGRIEQALAR
jgi:hypothetical protein